MEINEEKKAIDTLKEVASDNFDTLGDDISPKMAQNILNVIDKQQKDIEEKNIAINKMSKDISHQLKEIEELMKICDSYKNASDHCAENFLEVIKPNYINKDKIIEKIEHYNNELEHIKNGEEFENEKPMYYWGKVALEELLKEEDGDHIPRID